MLGLDFLSLPLVLPTHPVPFSSLSLSLDLHVCLLGMDADLIMLGLAFLSLSLVTVCVYADLIMLGLPFSLFLFIHTIGFLLIYTCVSQAWMLT